MFKNILFILSFIVLFILIVGLMFVSYNPTPEVDDCKKNPGKTYCATRTFTSENSPEKNAIDDTECSDSATQADAHFCIKKQLEQERTIDLQKPE